MTSLKNTILKFNKYLSTFNFIMCFVGYELVTSIFLPSSSKIAGISQTVTLPYRAFILIISLIVILLNFRKKNSSFPIALKLFLFFWFILIIRIFYDVFFRIDINLTDTSQLWLYIFGICLPIIFSTIKSYQFIDLESSLYWILGLIVLTLILTLFSNQAMFLESSAIKTRLNGNLALNTIAFGHLGVKGLILSLFVLIRKNLNWFVKTLLILSIFLCVFSMLRAGSRGPILSLSLVLIFWLISRQKNLLIGFIITFIVGLISYLFFDQIMELIGSISPIIENRLKSSIYKGDTNGRDHLYSLAINAFLESPIFGKQFAIFRPNGSFIYSHNIILDAFMGMGIIGGIILIYILVSSINKSYYLIKLDDANYWICLILIQQIVANMVSGSFYYDQLLSALFVFIFLYFNTYVYLSKKKSNNINY